MAYMLRGSAAQRAAVPGVPCAALQLLAMHVAGDFFLYWGHRCQHEGLGVLVGLPPAKSPWLWVSVHALHHTVRAPTPFATLYLHPLDTLLQVSLGVRLARRLGRIRMCIGCALGCGFAALRTGWITVRGLWLTTFSSQGGIPYLCAYALVRPHALVFAAAVALRTSENVLHHSALPAADWLSPAFYVESLFVAAEQVLRGGSVKGGSAGVAFHESHHRFCNHGGRASNYGEAFKFWDWMFGTLGATVAR